MTRGFVLGKFMPPHVGHDYLCETAARMVDDLTILVCWLPDDSIPGPARLRWMRELFPRARVLGHGAVVPQTPEEHPDFWAIWREVVRAAHPEPIDYLFAGEEYGLRLAHELGATFVPVGARFDPGAAPTHDPVSASAIRADPWGHWDWIAPPARAWFARTVVLHGPESVGKTTLARRLAERFGTVWVPEYGRSHCEAHGLDLTMDDLLLIGRAQAAMNAAALPHCRGRLIADTDALMTAAWAAMLFGEVPDELLGHPKGDLYLLLEPDVAWRDDGTRFFGQDERRARFMALSEEMLSRAGVPVVRVWGGWEERCERAVAAIEALGPPDCSGAGGAA